MMLKKEIKCGGHQQIKYGNKHKENNINKIVSDLITFD
jgi:hypothetical protein